MLRWRAFVLASGWFLVLGSAAFSVAAQTDGAPPPPPEPPPIAPVEPVAPPAPPTDAPPADVAPAPTPPPALPPPSGDFPLPPPAAEQPAARPVPPPAVQETPPPPAQSEPKARPLRASEGLFEEKKPAEVRHHESEDEEDKTDQFKIGPVVGAGIPSLLSVGGTVKVTRFLGAGVNLGLIPTVQLSYYGDATLSYKHLDFYGRIYPFGGGFFLGAGAGYVTVDGTLKKTYEGASYEGNGSVRTLMLTTLLGYFQTFDIGLSLGVDLGAQIPIAPSKIDFESKLTGVPPNTPAPLQAEIAKRKTEADQSVRDTLEKIGRTTLPTLNFRIGWIL